ncbi:quinone oxidoreductase family protein [Nakamurella lactea]|uniref:quinone oxidoreductase family protein n=1 Tax=Nakamurella lactea TaxID=459515 RepID=UPI0003FF83F4|nr:quinone oxidoreductase [Nakamurella lactea]
MTRAIQISRTGGPEVLVPADITVPEPGPGQATVEIAAAGVNFIDIYQREGRYPLDLPYVPGSEGAGRVTAVGADVDLVKVGDRVAWASLPGSYAGAVTGPADRLVPVPDGVSDEQAAALPLQGATAQYLARDSYPIAAGDTVLIHAGAGGVGLLLTQVAKILGATVITTVSTADKGELSSGAGADHVIVGYDDVAATVRELTGGDGVAAVYDGVGRDTFEGSLASLRRRGRMILFGASSGPVPPFDLQRLNPLGSLSVSRPTLKDFTVTREELIGRTDELFGWIADGRLTLRVGATYPLDQAAHAHQDLAGRRTTGKVLLIP